MRNRVYHSSSWSASWRSKPCSGRNLSHTHTVSISLSLKHTHSVCRSVSLSLSCGEQGREPLATSVGCAGPRGRFRKQRVYHSSSWSAPWRSKPCSGRNLSHARYVCFSLLSHTLFLCRSVSFSLTHTHSVCRSVSLTLSGEEQGREPLATTVGCAGPRGRFWNRGFYHSSSWSASWRSKPCSGRIPIRIPAVSALTGRHGFTTGSLCEDYRP